MSGSKSRGQTSPSSQLKAQQSSIKATTKPPLRLLFANQFMGFKCFWNRNQSDYTSRTIFYTPALQYSLMTVFITVVSVIKQIWGLFSCTWSDTGFLKWQLIQSFTEVRVQHLRKESPVSARTHTESCQFFWKHNILSLALSKRNELYIESWD